MRVPRTGAQSGFTLIELMVTLAIIGVISAIAIPGMLRARISANEGSAIGTLRTVSTAQVQFQQRLAVDQDGDPEGEFGLLGEMAGTTGRRAQGGGTAPPLDPPELPPQLAPSPPEGDLGIQGFELRLYLPGEVGVGPITDDGDPAGQPGSTDGAAIDAQEQSFRVYAWPTSFYDSGYRVFAIDQSDVVRTLENDAGDFDAKASPTDFARPTLPGGEVVPGNSVPLAPGLAAGSGCPGDHGLLWNVVVGAAIPAPPQPPHPQPERGRARCDSAGRNLAALAGIEPDSVDGALQIVEDPGRVQTILQALDQDEDGLLSFDELLAIDVRALAQQLKGELVGPDESPEVGFGDELQQAYQSYLQDVADTQLAGPPPVPLAEILADPLTDLAAPPQLLAGLILASIPTLGPAGRLLLLGLLGAAGYELIRRSRRTRSS